MTQYRVQKIPFPKRWWGIFAKRGDDWVPLRNGYGGFRFDAKHKAQRHIDLFLVEAISPNLMQQPDGPSK